jgi:exportin-5
VLRLFAVRYGLKRMEGSYAEVVGWVRKILDPQCSAEERAVCHQHVEDLKERRNDCLVCGFHLARSVDPIIRHFGLQLLEHFVRYRWQHLHELGRRDFSLQLLDHISRSILPMEEEAVYVKESLARLVVELAQKTWPQHWHTFLEDMDLLTRHGPAQVEVVLLVFRRLAEDLHPQSNAPLSPQRRKEMSAALRDQLGVVYQFIMRNLEVPEAPALCGVALSSLTYYVEWLDWSDLLASDCKLLRLLYSFISVEQLKTDACECLLAILSRKGDLKRTLKQREKLLILLSKDALQVILDAALKAAGCGVDEVQYVFIKRVCQVLVELGTSQIARLWEAKFKPPQGFGFYLEVMLEFFKHDSQLVCLTATSLWSAFLTHGYIIDDPDFRRILPQLFPEACKKLIRVGNPGSSSSDPVTQYNKLDFDDQNEYITFYSMFRNRLGIMLIRMCQKGAIPENAFDQTLKLTTTLTQQFPSQQCDRESPLYLKWDGFVAVMESWTNVMKSDSELRDLLREKAVPLARLVLNYDPGDALVLCCVLRCMNSGLLWVVDIDPQLLLQPYLQKIFSCVESLGKVESKVCVLRDSLVVDFCA